MPLQERQIGCRESGQVPYGRVPSRQVNGARVRKARRRQCRKAWAWCAVAKAMRVRVTANPSIERTAAGARRAPAAAAHLERYTDKTNVRRYRLR